MTRKGGFAARHPAGWRLACPRILRPPEYKDLQSDITGTP